MTLKERNAVRAAFELAAQAPPEDRYVLRLYVTGMTPRSARAVKNLQAICDEYLDGRYDLEVIDIYQQPVLDEGRADHRRADAHQEAAAADAPDHRRHVEQGARAAGTRPRSGF